jgi:hypothetical protein
MGLEDRDYMSLTKRSTYQVKVCAICGHSIEVCGCLKPKTKEVPIDVEDVLDKQQVKS